MPRSIISKLLGATLPGCTTYCEGNAVPELPEVETTRRGIEILLQNHTVDTVNIYDKRLRRPVTENLPSILPGAKLSKVTRRAKYLLLDFLYGTLVIHLGMSGSLRVVSSKSPRQKHDHVEIHFSGDLCMRFRDPRRFGLLLWLESNPMEHTLLRDLGPEPFDPVCDGGYLFDRSRGRTLAIKNFIMDAHIIAGVGNIYANESLFRARVHPGRAAGRIGLRRYQRLSNVIRSVLTGAIEVGGTTLRDFVSETGAPGYFGHELQVYGRAGEPCIHCGQALRSKMIGQRSSFFCSGCQR